MATIKKFTHKLKAGESKPQVSYKVQVNKKGYDRYNFTSKTKAAAEKRAREVETAMESGTWDEFANQEKKIGNTILSAVIERYLKEVSPFKKGAIATLKYETATLNEISRSRIGKMDIFKIQTGDIDALKTYLITRVDKEGLEENNQHSLTKIPALKENTVNRKLTVLQSLFTQAKLRWNYNIASNPVRGMLYKGVNDERNRELQPFEVEDIIQSLRSANNPYPCWIFEIALETGARRKEIFENSWGNVDFDKKLFTIPAPIAKTRKERKIPLSPKAIEVFQTIYNKDTPKPTDLITPITIHSFKSAWRRAMEKCAVPDVQFRDSRHVAITNLAKIYPRCQSLAKISGHRKLETLLRYYDETDAERVEQMDEFYKKQLKK